jgi:hypothetical protein
MQVKFGAIIVDGSGKVGGHVITRNHYGKAMRTKVTPAQPHSSAQQIVKARMTAAAQAWRGLNSGVREAFASLAANVSRTNAFGDVSRLSGFALFMRLNRNLSEAGGSPLTTCPVQPVSQSVLTLTLAAAAGTPNVTLGGTASDTPTAFTLIMQFTPQISAGIAYANSKFRTLAHQVGAATITYDGTTSYPAKFGTLVAGNKIFARAKLVHTTSGFSSGWVQVSTVVTA